MTLEKDPELERQDVLRQFITFHLKKALVENDPPVILTDMERSSTVDQIAEFWGDLLEDTVVAAVDHLFADDAEEEPPTGNTA